MDDLHTIFEIRERRDPDGARRLAVIGELDLATVHCLRDRLRSLSRQTDHVRLDLSQLSFIGSSGIRELVTAADDARRDGWTLEINEEVSAQVRRMVDLAGVGTRLWSQVNASA